MKRIHIEYDAGPPVTHGGQGVGTCLGTPLPTSTKTQATLAPGEFIHSVLGRAGRYVDGITFVTNQRSIGPSGSSSNGEPFELRAPNGYQIRRLFGRAGAFVDAIGIVVEKMP